MVDTDRLLNSRIGSSEINPFDSHRARTVPTLLDSMLDLAVPTTFNSNYEEVDTNHRSGKTMAPSPIEKKK